MSRPETISLIEFDQQKALTNLQVARTSHHSRRLKGLLRTLESTEQEKVYPLFFRGLVTLLRRADGTFIGKSGQEDTGIWENVAEHSLMVSLVTDVLSEALGLTVEERKKINQAGLLHDSNKKTERQWQLAIDTPSVDDSSADEITFNADQRTEAKQTAMQQLQAMEEWENAELGIPTEVTTLSRANIPGNAEGHQSLQEKIMWFADACVSGDQITPISTRFDDLLNSIAIPEARRHANREFSESYKPQYQGKTLYEVQVILGEKYVDEFVKVISDATKETFYRWLKQKVDHKLRHQQLPVL